MNWEPRIPDHKAMVAAFKMAVRGIAFSMNPKWIQNLESPIQQFIPKVDEISELP